MRLVLLVGASGTGKSFQAMRLAREKGVRHIIDDGLLIKDHRVLGGRSAKKEASRLGAIRCAVFLEEEHRREVRELLHREQPEQLMILGTSRRMVETIMEQLALEGTVEVVGIDELTGEEEIRLAKKIRKQEGKHVIPVPTFELKRDFSGFFLNPLKSLKKWGKEEAGLAEKSVVRPTFSYLGKYTISDGVIRRLVQYAVESHTVLRPAGRIFVRNTQWGLVIEMDVNAPFGILLTRELKNAQKKIQQEVEGMTAFHVAAVELTVRKWIGG